MAPYGTKGVSILKIHGENPWLKDDLNIDCHGSMNNDAMIFKGHSMNNQNVETKRNHHRPMEITI